MFTTILLAMLGAWLTPTVAVATEVESGPTVGSVAGPLKVLVIVGDATDQSVDFVATRKEKTTVFVLIDAEKWDRPTARYLKTLDTAIKSDHPNVAVVAVWLSDDRDATKDYLPKAQQSLRLEATSLTVAEDGRSGPDAWAINADAHVTTVVVREGRVAARFGYRSLNETDVRAVLKALK
jgi:hypothetical protein